MAARALLLRSLASDSPELRIADETTTLGRSNEADSTISDDSISRRHAQLHQTPTGWRITDLGSTQGTFLNGLRLSEDEEAHLQDGDTLRLGSLTYQASLSGPPFESTELSPRLTPPPTPTITRDEFLTRGSLLLRLGAEDTLVRELSWQDFHTQYAPILRSFARKAGCPADQVDDIVQEVMTAFFKASEQFEYDPAKGRFRGYLKTATIRALQQQRHKSRGAVQWEPERFLEQPEEVDEAWDTEWMNQLLTRAIHQVRATTKIADSSWDAFELYGRRGLPLPEAAAQLQMQPEAVKKAKNRVTTLVREELDRLRQEEG
jgi:RNA polymerase sigma-70 factor (ECF subfamily)